VSSTDDRLACQTLDRAAILERLRFESFDLAIIGGGINGAAIARDAALRGLRVALVDKGDFANATSSRSSKLIHGGLRYLPQGQIGMVFKALRERERLRHLAAPHLVSPIRFLLPFYRRRRPGRLALIAGLTLYDWMARTPRAERHHLMTSAHIQEIEPGLRAEGLVGGATYIDGRGDDARITIENLLDASYNGAAILNYAAVEAFTRSGTALNGMVVRDLEQDAPFEVRARLMINAAGPWVDDMRRLDHPSSPPCARLTKGIHIVVAKERLPVREALVLTDHSGRIIFVMPHGGHVLIGTTDTDFTGDREHLMVETEEIEYLLGVVEDALPDFRLSTADVVAAFAGLRVLPRAEGDLRPSSVPREELVIESTSGLISIAGGKLTTHRAIAENVVDSAVARLAINALPCVTTSIPLPGARASKSGDAALRALPQFARDVLKSRYGNRAGIVAAIASSDLSLTRPLSVDAPAIGAEVIFAVRLEMARSVGDFLIRRTAMTWRAPQAALTAGPAVAHLMAAELRWSSEREARELERFRLESKPLLRSE